MSTSTPHKWAVTGQEEHPDLDEHGNPTVKHHVQFKTASGHESSVTLDHKDFSAQNVHQAIEHKATEIEKVATMTSAAEPAPPGQE